MRISLRQDGDDLCFYLEAEEEDHNHLNAVKIGLANHEARINLGGLKIEDIHPDLIGLSCILMCHQFVGKELHLPVCVSNGFYEAANGILSKYKILAEIDSGIEQNTPLERSRPGLAFSGGADSTAALAVMPGNTVPVFMNRPIRESSMYNSDAPIKNCELLRQIGFDVRIIDCDLEYLRDPVGFPSDLAHAIPLILISGSLGIGSIAFGTVLESAYGIGHEHYIDYPNGSHKRFYGTLLSAVGLELSLPVGGVSEVGTSSIVEASPFRDLAQSCIRGMKGSPCMRCWKCFRKELLSLALFPDREIDLEGMMRNSSEIQIRLSSYPISHENVVTYSIQRIDIAKYPSLRHLRNRLNTKAKLDLLDYWYSPAQELVPEQYRLSVIEKISKYLPTMTKEHERALESWDMDDFLLSEEAKRGHSSLTSSWQDL
jgi:hypothetical protein